MDCSLDDYVKKNKIGKKTNNTKSDGKSFYNKGNGEF